MKALEVMPRGGSSDSSGATEARARTSGGARAASHLLVNLFVKLPTEQNLSSTHSTQHQDSTGSACTRCAAESPTKTHVPPQMPHLARPPLPDCSSSKQALVERRMHPLHHKDARAHPRESTVTCVWVRPRACTAHIHACQLLGGAAARLPRRIDDGCTRRHENSPGLEDKGDNLQV